VSGEGEAKVKPIAPNILARLASLFARTESPFQEEARTSALLAVQLMRRHGLLPEELVKRLAELANKPRRKAVSHKDFSRRGGAKGGKARAAKLSPARRSEIARDAANKRWRKSPNCDAPTRDTEPCLPVKHETPRLTGRKP